MTTIADLLGGFSIDDGPATLFTAEIRDPAGALVLDQGNAIQVAAGRAAQIAIDHIVAGHSVSGDVVQARASAEAAEASAQVAQNAATQATGAVASAAEALDAALDAVESITEQAAQAGALAGQEASQAAVAAHASDTTNPHQTSALQVPFLGAGTGAVARTTRDKLDDGVDIADFGAKGSGLANDRVALLNAMTYVAQRGGGRVTNRRLPAVLIEGDILAIPGSVTLDFETTPIQRIASGQVWYADAYGTLVIGTGAKIQTNRGSGLRGMNIIRAGMVKPSSIGQALALRDSFSQTAIEVGTGAANTGSDTKIEEVLVAGFDKGIVSDGHQRVSVSRFMADCTNPLYVANAGGKFRGAMGHLWPWLTANNGSATRTTWTITGVANNGSGGIRVTTGTTVPAELHGRVVVIKSVGGVTAANGRFTVAVTGANSFDLVAIHGLNGALGAAPVFSGGYTSGGTVTANANARFGIGVHFGADVEWGELKGFITYALDVGYRINDTSRSMLIDCGSDHDPTAADPTSIGMWLSGYTRGTTISNWKTSSLGIGLLVETLQDPGVSGGNIHTFEGFECGGSIGPVIDHRGGDLVISSGRIGPSERIVKTDSAGNLVIGPAVVIESGATLTASETARLTISGWPSTVSTGLPRQDTNTTSDGRRVWTQINGSAPVTMVGRRAKGTATSPAAIAQQDLVWRHLAEVWNGAGWGEIADIAFRARGTDGQGGRIEFNTRPNGSGSLTKALTITETGRLHLGETTDPGVFKVSGSPEGSISAPPGTLALRDSGTTNQAVYVKETGTGNTGWVRVITIGSDGLAAMSGLSVPAVVSPSEMSAGSLFPIVKAGDNRSPLAVDLVTGKVYLDPTPAAAERIALSLYEAPSLRGIAQPMNVRRISLGLLAGMVQETDGRVSEVVQPTTGAYDTAVVHDARPLPAILIAGQSRAGHPASDQDSPFLTPRFRHHALMFNGGPVRQGTLAVNPADLTDLVGLRDGVLTNLPSLPVLAGLAREMHDRSAGLRSPARIWRADNYSGGAITLINKGSLTYSNMMASAAAVPVVAARYGRASGYVPAVVFIQGETGSDGYAALLDSYLDEMPGDVQAASGQATPPKVLIIQVDEADSAGDHTDARLAHVAAARARPTITVMVGPNYDTPRFDENHETLIGRMMLGERLADVVRALEGESHDWAGSWTPFWTTSVVREGAVIKLTYSTPYGLPLQWDGDWIAAVANKGYQYTDDSGAPPAITDVQIVGTNQVWVTLASEPTGANKRLSYALLNESPVADDGWTLGRGHLRVDTGRASVFAALGYAVPATIRHYACAERLSIA